MSLASNSASVAYERSTKDGHGVPSFTARSGPDDVARRSSQSNPRIGPRHSEVEDFSGPYASAGVEQMDELRVHCCRIDHAYIIQLHSVRAGQTHRCPASVQLASGLEIDKLAVRSSVARGLGRGHYAHVQPSSSALTSSPLGVHFASQLGRIFS